VTNLGGGAATSATITDKLPPGLSFSSASGTNWTCSALNGLLTCTYAGSPGIAAGGGTSTIAVSVQLIDDTLPSFLNRVSIDSTGGSTPADPTACAPSSTCAEAYTEFATSVTAAPALQLVKTAVVSGGTADLTEVGDTVTWTLTATNTGNVTLTGLSLSDSLTRQDDAATSLTLASGPSLDSGSTSLAPGEAAVYSASYVLTQADIDAGGVANTATATASSPTATADVSDTSDDGVTGVGDTGADPTLTSVTAAPALTVTKTVDDTSLADGVRVDDLLVYTITVKNTGNVTLSDITLVDDFKTKTGVPLTLSRGPDLLGPQKDTLLDVGEIWTFTANYRLGADTITAGGLENIATVTGTAPSGATVSAESKVTGNTSDDGNGIPTETGFLGEISGYAKEYLAGVEGATIYLLVETEPGSGSYDYATDENGQRIAAVTDAQGYYVFLNIPAGNYGVEFAETASGTSPNAVSDDFTASGNRITSIDVKAGAVEVHQDVFFLDPSGVVYDSETHSPILGAKVTLYYNGSPVPDAWLNTTMGHANRSLTGADGVYSYFFDPAVAPSGVYTIKVEKIGYKPSEAIPPSAGPFVPRLGGDIQGIVSDEVPSDGMDHSYYLTIDLTFDPENQRNTSNGVVRNHIPMDRQLLPMVEDEVVEILKNDLALSILQQGRQMSGYAEDALTRLKLAGPKACLKRIDAILEKQPIHFATGTAILLQDSNSALDSIAAVLQSCAPSRFEITGYTGRAEGNNSKLGLARAEAVARAISQRGVEPERLVLAGYGADRQIAENIRDAAWAGPHSIVFTLVQDGNDDGCVNAATGSHALTASVHDGQANISGDFSAETHSCATDSWRIISGSTNYMRADAGIDQLMFNLALRRERLVFDDRVRGRFVGIYGSSSNVSAPANGTVLGFGSNTGLYGANRLGRRLYFDYYLGVAAGRHAFDLNFDRDGGTINASGAYHYGAAFIGAAVSGETKAFGLEVTPRAGVNLAWSPGGTGSLLATRGALKDSEGLKIPTVMGAQLFVESRIERFVPSISTNLAFTPRLLCDKAIDCISGGCGIGASLDFDRHLGDLGAFYSLRLDAERTTSHTSADLTLRYGWPLGLGQIDGGIQMSTSGEMHLQHNFKIEF
jgi:uncharacterized repeat protein (TIGR01451 family)